MRKVHVICVVCLLGASTVAGLFAADCKQGCVQVSAYASTNNSGGVTACRYLSPSSYPGGTGTSSVTSTNADSDKKGKKVTPTENVDQYYGGTGCNSSCSTTCESADVKNKSLAQASGSRTNCNGPYTTSKMMCVDKNTSG